MQAPQPRRILEDIEPRDTVIEAYQVPWSLHHSTVYAGSMCGIFFSCSKNDHRAPSDSLCHELEQRGPDHCNTTEVIIGDSTGHSAEYLTFIATVLSLRGNRLVEQPLIDPATSSVLCWNGEAWKIDGTAIVGNDAAVVFDLLLKATVSLAEDPSAWAGAKESAYEEFVDVISRITGPYAFVYYDALHAQIFYGRDRLGRRSLLTNDKGKGSFAISSICDPNSAHDWLEVEADAVHRLDLHADGEACGSTATTFPPTLPPTQRPVKSETYATHQTRPKPAHLWPLNKATPTAPAPIHTPSSSTVDDLNAFLEASLRLRVDHVPVPPCNQLDPPRLAVLFSGGLDCTLLARMVHDICPAHYEIDLLNVAFENPRVIEAAAKRGGEALSQQSVYASCPDRITGKSSHQELTEVCPGRNWRLVDIDIPYADALEHRSRIVSLMHPHHTEMDLSIACALYFAARGRGQVHEPVGNTTEAYKTPARVLLSGLGADEIFGGYQRHTTAFHRAGYPALIEELELDFSRLGKRNLGRDDRVISHWGKEVRYPYLDDDLVAWAVGLPVWEKCGFGEPVDVEKGSGTALDPGKKLLRLLALKKGLQGAAFEKKRAIQFGARTAKMEAGRVKGTQSLA